MQRICSLKKTKHIKMPHWTYMRRPQHTLFWTLWKDWIQNRELPCAKPNLVETIIDQADHDYITPNQRNLVWQKFYHLVFQGQRKLWFIFYWANLLASKFEFFNVIWAKPCCPVFFSFTKSSKSKKWPEMTCAQTKPWLRLMRTHNDVRDKVFTPNESSFVLEVVIYLQL